MDKSMDLITVSINEETGQKTLTKRIPHHRANQEIKILKMLKTNNVPYLLEYSVEKEGIAIKTCYIEGDPFDQKHQTEVQEKTFNWIKKTPYLYWSIVKKLDCIHKLGIYHRDLRPQNIIIDESDHCQIIDFGSAIIKADVHLETNIIGTLKFVAPEAIFNPKGYNELSDFYALSKMFLYLYDAYLDQLNPQFVEILIKASEIQPKNRFANTSALIHAVEKIL